jgi:hypothetical protein
MDSYVSYTTYTIDRSKLTELKARVTRYGRPH